MQQIRKIFKFEAAHRVRTSTGSRCKNSIHGHSYIVELFLVDHSNTNDMVMDFGDLKKCVGEFFDCLDHATFIWKDDSESYKNAIREFSKRVILMERDPTAENMARTFLKKCTQLLVKEDAAPVRVRVHETATGYAEAVDFLPSDNIEVLHDNSD